MLELTLTEVDDVAEGVVVRTSRAWVAPSVAITGTGAEMTETAEVGFDVVEGRTTDASTPPSCGIAPDDWARVDLPWRFVEVAPSAAFEISSVSGGGEPHAIAAPGFIWR